MNSISLSANSIARSGSSFLIFSKSADSVLSVLSTALAIVNFIISVERLIAPFGLPVANLCPFWNAIDRIPYAAPELQYMGRTKEEAEKRIAEGQVPTDVWSMSIVGTASKERLGYPNQKPIKLMKRAIVASSNEGDTVLDPFGGSGSTAAAAMEANRKFITGDSSPDAIAVMKRRFQDVEIAWSCP